MNTKRLLFWLLLTAALAAGSCTPDSTSNGAAATGKVGEPGIEFTRVSVGLPSETLDYIGGSAVALAGAKAGNKVFFAVREEEEATIYCRDLNSGERSTLNTVPDLLPGSLVTDAQGATLVYNRGKRIDTYIDDPNIREPMVIALPHRYDVKSGKEESVFDFRDPAYLPFRADRAGVFISPDGKRIVMLSYNRDELTLITQVRQWLSLYDDVQQGGQAVAEWGLEDPQAALRELLVAPYVKPRLAALGVEPAAEGKVTAEEQAAMKRLSEELVDPPAVLLLSEEGKQRLLPLEFAEEYRSGYVNSILAVSNNHVLVYASAVGDTSIKPHNIFDVNLETGACTHLSEFLGSASTIEISADESQVLVVYNPVDAEQNELKNESHFLRIPFAGDAPAESTLPGDFVAYVDITSDGAWLIGQQSGENDLYLVNTAKAEEQLLCKLLGQVEGLFLADGGRSAVYLENGIAYHLSIPEDPAASPTWIDADRFAEYQPLVEQFIADLGFTVPAYATYEWEEREGLGAHEVSVGIVNPDKPGTLALVRYSVKQQKVVSVWFPTEIPFGFTATHTGEDMDYYECKDLATSILEKVGWLDPATMQEFHPGPNPLFDQGTNSYIVMFRDGYWHGSGENQQWVFNEDATVRILADSGMVAEMTLAALDEVKDQPISLSLERAEHFLRNNGEMPIPEGAPIRFDLDNKRLVVGQKSIEALGPAKYTSELQSRICYEIDAYLQPEDVLMMTGLVDAENGDVLGQINYQQGGIERYLDIAGSTT